MYTLSRRPSKPKQPNGDPKASNHGTVKPMLRVRLPSPFTDRFSMQSHIDHSVAEDSSDHGDTNTDTNGDEDKTILVRAEMVNFRERIGDRSEEYEEHSKCKGSVERDESYKGLE